LIVSSSPSAFAAIVYTVPNSTYFQDFDSLPILPENTSLGTTANGAGWIDDATAPAVNQVSVPGWYLYHPADQTTGEGGVNGHQRFRIGAGTQNTGAFMSFGLSGSTERALGDVGSTTIGANNSELYIGVRITNNTGQTLQRFTLSYDGEQWRDGGNATPVAQGMTFGWSANALSINDPSAVFTQVNELGFMSPVFTTTAGAVDGNSAGLVGVGPVTVTGINWLAGTDLWLRWTDLSHPGNDHGLAIDNISFSAVAIPEPSLCGVLAIGALRMLTRGRRRTV
jgi:hypothetical protein